MTTHRIDVSVLSRIGPAGAIVKDCEPAAATPATPPCRLPDFDAILFDTYNVLFDQTGWWRWLIQLFGQIGMHTSYRACYALWQTEYEPRVNDAADLWSEFARFLASMGFRPAQVQEILVAGKSRYEEFDEGQHPLPEVIPTLARLAARGVRMGIASSSTKSQSELELFLRRGGLSGYFHWIGRIRDAQHGTASVAAYQAAARHFAAAPDRVVFVGQSPPQLAAARQAGLLVVKCGESACRDTSPLAIESLSVLPELVATAEPVRRAG